MRRVDPEIKLVAVGVDNDTEWNADMVRTADSYIDYLSIHTYIFTDRQGKTYDELVAWPIYIEENLKHIYSRNYTPHKRLYTISRQIQILSWSRYR